MSNNITRPIQQLIAELEQKKASLKKAEDPSTSHPVGKVDNATQSMPTGEQAKANEKMISEDVPGTSVDAATPVSQSPTEQDKQQISIGMNPASTGQDPSVEKDIKEKPSDPGTTHPARTDIKSAADYLQAADAFSKNANAFLASVSLSGTGSQPASEPVEKSASEPAAADEELAKAAEFGYQLAAELGMADLTDQSIAKKTIAETVKNASLNASLVFDYLSGFAKSAANEMMGESHLAPGDTAVGPAAAGEEEGAAPAVEGESMEAPGPSEADIEALLGQIAKEEEPDPSAPPSEDELLEQLAAALAEREMAPSELPAKMASNSRYTTAEVRKIADSVSNFMKAGKFRFRPATTKRAATIRERVSGVIREIVGS